MIKLTERGRVQYISHMFRLRRFLRERMSDINDFRFEEVAKTLNQVFKRVMLIEVEKTFPVNIPSTSLKSCFTLDVLNFSFK